MASDLLFRKPSIDVVQGDDYIGPMFGKVAAAATVTYLVPGKLVKYSTYDGSVDIAGANDTSGNVGIIGYEKTPLAFKPATRDTAYAAGDHVAIHNTPGMRFRGWVINGAAITPGMTLTHLAADSSGNFSQFLGSNGTYGPFPLARALESVAAPTGTVAVACWMEWL
jgi:hypothetical protein